LAAVATFFLFYYLHFPRDTLLARLSLATGGVLADVIVLALERFLLVANACIGLFALLVILRPSLLKPLEAWMNRWLSARAALRPLEQSRAPLDRITARFPRLIGALILLGGAWVLGNLVVLTQGLDMAAK